jgi:hypothetical protein
MARPIALSQRFSESMMADDKCALFAGPLPSGQAHQRECAKPHASGRNAEANQFRPAQEQQRAAAP